MAQRPQALKSKFLPMLDGEEQLRTESLRRISESPRLSLSLHALEASNSLINHIVHQDPQDEDDLAVKCLGIRLFNGISASLGLLLRGYYQVAASVQRDLLETAYLLDFLALEAERVSSWRLSSPQNLKKNFGPSTIRNAPEKRDKFYGRRTEAYDLLCQLAAHPTPLGFRMLQVDGVNAHCGPFLRGETLEATLVELTKLSVVASINLGIHFRAQHGADLLAQVSALEVQSEWREEFYGVPADKAGFEEMRRMAAEIDNA